MTVLVLDWAAAAVAGPQRAGGKGWQLGVLAGLGAPVPPGFVIDSEAFVERPCEGDLAAPLVAALARALDVRGWTDLPLAVRSSASSEDSARASFAGIYRSFLNVRGVSGLIDAVRRIRESSREPAALAYCERLGLDGDASRMAVVVMPMVPAVASGVAFTCDPVSGREDQVIIHGNWGLGESLVGGQIDADEYCLQESYPDASLSLVARKCGTKVHMTAPCGKFGTRKSDTPRALAARFVLTPLQAIELGNLVRDAATALDYTRPLYDIEWVWDGVAFSIVQARPVTTRGRQTYPGLMGQPTVWSRGNSRDVLPDPLPALDRSVSMPLINRMLTRNAALAGYQTMPGVQRTTLHHGRVFFETSTLQWESYDGFDVSPKAYNRLLGGHQPEICVRNATPGERLSRAWRGMRFLRKCVWPRLKAKSTLARAHQAAARRLAERAPGDARALATELHAQVLRMRSAEDLMLLQASGSALLVLLDLLERYFPEQGGALAASLMSGGEPSVTAALSHELLQLAHTAEADAAALEWLRSPRRPGQDWRGQLANDSTFGRAFEAFLRRFGHRAVYESYLHNPRWRENPDYLLDTVSSLIGYDAAPLHDRQLVNSRAACRRIRQGLPIWCRPLIPVLVKLAIAERNMRESARSAFTAHSGVTRRLVLALGERCSAAGDLQSAQDVFHLTLAELRALADGHLSASHAAKRVALRRRQFDAFSAYEAPDVIIESHGSAASITPIVTGRQARADRTEWRGIVAADGYAIGSAHIAHRPAEALKLVLGDILVAPATDPSWTPAFLKAGAIVMETGGYLSHGAIVARELGIPAVVNLPGILDAIRMGDRLEVDANKGLVRRR